MGQRIKLGDAEYDVENLSAKAKAELSSLQFVVKRIEELKKNAIFASANKKKLYKYFETGDDRQQIWFSFRRRLRRNLKCPKSQ